MQYANCQEGIDCGTRPWLIQTHWKCKFALLLTGGSQNTLPFAYTSALVIAAIVGEPWAAERENVIPFDDDEMPKQENTSINEPLLYKMMSCSGWRKKMQNWTTISTKKTNRHPDQFTRNVQHRDIPVLTWLPCKSVFLLFAEREINSGEIRPIPMIRPPLEDEMKNANFNMANGMESLRESTIPSWSTLGSSHA